MNVYHGMHVDMSNYSTTRVKLINNIEIKNCNNYKYVIGNK